MLFTSACYGGGDDCCYESNNPCYYKDFEIEGKSIAFLDLDPANRYWVPPIIGSGNIKFKKVNALAEITYFRSAITRTYTKLNVRTSAVYDSTCKRNVYTRDYANCVYETFSYSGSPGAKLDLSVTRKATPGPYKVGEIFDSINFYQSSDLLHLNFANLQFLLNPKTFVNSESQKFHPSITFENIAYDSVYELWKPYTDTTYIIPQGIYYSCKVGIIGMYLTNKVEVWYKK